jgi:hypothetical protein
LVRNLHGKVIDVNVGGGRRSFFLSLKDSRTLAVFDVNAADVVKPIPLASPDAVIAVGARKLIVAFPDERIVKL